MIDIKILPNKESQPANKLADVEFHFSAGELEGLKLVGSAVWRSRDGNGYNVTLPARQFTVHGDRRSFTLLRFIADPGAQERVRNLVLRAYEDCTREAATK